MVTFCKSCRAFNVVTCVNVFIHSGEVRETTSIEVVVLVADKTQASFLILFFLFKSLLFFSVHFPLFSGDGNSE